MRLSECPYCLVLVCAISLAAAIGQFLSVHHEPVDRDTCVDVLVRDALGSSSVESSLARLHVSMSDWLEALAVYSAEPGFHRLVEAGIRSAASSAVSTAAAGGAPSVSRGTVMPGVRPITSGRPGSDCSAGRVRIATEGEGGS